MSTIVNRLQRQANSQTWVITFDNADVAANHGVQELVTRAIHFGNRYRSKVLKVDPVGDDHWCRQQSLQKTAIFVQSRIVIVQEYAAGQVAAPGPAALREDDCRVIGQPPLRTNL